MRNIKEEIEDLRKQFNNEKKSNREAYERIGELTQKIKELEEDQKGSRSELISNWILPILLIMMYFYLNSENGRVLIENDYLSHSYTVISITLLITLIFTKQIIYSTKWMVKKILQKGYIK